VAKWDLRASVQAFADTLVYHSRYIDGQYVQIGQFFIAYNAKIKKSDLLEWVTADQRFSLAATRPITKVQPLDLIQSSLFKFVVYENFNQENSYNPGLLLESTSDPAYASNVYSEYYFEYRRTYDAITDNGSGQTLVICEQHGLLTNQYITITGSNVYNGLTKITVIDNRRFLIDKLYSVSDNSGTWRYRLPITVPASSLKVDASQSGSYFQLAQEFGIAVWRKFVTYDLLNSLYTDKYLINRVDGSEIKVVLQDQAFPTQNELFTLYKATVEKNT
jgi:hypothetical protein